MRANSLSMRIVIDRLKDPKLLSRNTVGFIATVLMDNESDDELYRFYKSVTSTLWDLDLLIMNRKEKQLVQKNITEEKFKTSILMSKNDYDLFTVNRKEMKLSVHQYLSFLVRFHNEMLNTRFELEGPEGPEGPEANEA